MLLNIGLAIIYKLKPRILEAESFGKSLHFFAHLHIEQLISMMEHFQEYIHSDFADLLRLACQINPPKDFTLPNMYQYAKMRRLRFASMKLGNHIFEEDQITFQKDKQKKKQMLKEKLERNKRNNDVKKMKINFYQQFYLLNGLSKLRNLKDYNKREDLFKNLTDGSSSKDEGSQRTESITKNEEDEANAQNFEAKAVKCYKCDPSWPICLYDFTFRELYADYLCYQTQHSFEKIINVDHYYATDRSRFNKDNDEAVKTHYEIIAAENKAKYPK